MFPQVEKVTVAGDDHVGRPVDGCGKDYVVIRITGYDAGDMGGFDSL